MTGNWLIGGAMKVNRVLDDKEVKAINKAAGVSDLPRAQPFSAKKFGFAGGGSVNKLVIPDYVKNEELANYRNGTMRGYAGGGVVHMADGGQPNPAEYFSLNDLQEPPSMFERLMSGLEQGQKYIKENALPAVNSGLDAAFPSRKIARIGFDQGVVKPINDLISSSSGYLLVSDKNESDSSEAYRHIRNAIKDELGMGRESGPKVFLGGLNQGEFPKPPKYPKRGQPKAHGGVVHMAEGGSDWKPHPENDLLQPIGSSKMVGEEKLVADDGPFKSGLSMFPSSKKSYRYVYHDEDQTPIGAMQIATQGPRSKKAVIQNLYVAEANRRQGIASKLLDRARKDFDVKHSNDLTTSGKAFAKAKKAHGGRVTHAHHLDIEERPL
jgi:hypothetical protein